MILLVGSTPGPIQLVQSALRAHDLPVETSATVREGQERALHRLHELIIIERTLPDGDGVEFCRTLRCKGILAPILMIDAAPGDGRGPGRGGPDEVLAAPFSNEELIARVRGLLATTGYAAAVAPLAWDDLELDAHRGWARRGERRIRLSQIEVALLTYFITHANRPISREEISGGALHPGDEATPDAIDVLISNVRAKVDSTGEPPLLRVRPDACYEFGGRWEQPARHSGAPR
ncbi:MAG: response regulator transcription factor [Phycisphaerales bacterium]|nr:response regulator transcription factor [Phycisphaerales bacterium]